MKYDIAKIYWEETISREGKVELFFAVDKVNSKKGETNGIACRDLDDLIEEVVGLSFFNPSKLKVTTVRKVSHDGLYDYHVIPLPRQILQYFKTRYIELSKKKSKSNS